MNIEGTYTLQAAPEKVWQCLMDQQVLQRTLPGVEHIEQITSDCYQVAVSLKNTPLSGTYHGRIMISEQQYPYHYRLTIEGDGEQNPINGGGTIHLNGQGDTTIIAYKGDVTEGKRSMLLPPLLIKGAAKLFLQRFFNALADHLRLLDQAEVGSAQEGIESTQVSVQTSGGIIALSTQGMGKVYAGQPTQDAPRTIFYRVAHLFKLGKGDQEQEQRWGKRLQQASTVSGLLFLVWVGTRLPRKRA